MLRDRLPVTADDVRQGLLTAENPGRFQVLPGRPVVVLDVAHNAAAASALARNLARMPRAQRTFAVFGMLADKDIAAVASEVKEEIDEWLIASIDAPRGADSALVAAALALAGIGENVSKHPSIAAAYAQARDRAAENDRIVVFGSFYTVAAVMAARGAPHEVNAG